LVLAMALLSGCAAQLEHRNGMALLADGKPVEAVESLRRASTLAPDNRRYRVDYLQQSANVAFDLADQGDEARRKGNSELAGRRYREAARLDSGNDRAKAGLQALEAERRVQTQLLAVDRLIQSNQTEQALEQLRVVLRENPQQARALELRRQLEDRADAERAAREEQLAARAAFKRPVTLQFRDATLRMVLEALSRAGKINVIIDRDVKADARTTLFVKDASIEDALDVILLQNQLEKRVLNSNSLMVYPATAAKQKELAELKIRTFQLGNVDAAFMANIVKTMLKTKDIVTDAKTNTLVMRDTPEAIALAERLVAANDLPDPEVMLEVEVLEVSSSHASEIGLKLPNGFTLSTPSTGADGSGLTLGALRALGRNSLLASPLSATLNLMLKDSDTNILARPRIRSRNKEKARVLVGDKLPVITNIISPQSTGQNSVLTGSIQYVDVGIKLEVEPQVYADGDVGIKLNLEISNVSDTIITQGGRAYQIGTRSAQTALRLHDGETQILAGLISDDDRKAAQKVPGIGQLPVLGRLFSNHSDDTSKREIVLSITPHIIRPQAQTDLRNADAWSGSEGSLRDRPLRLEPLSVVKALPPSGTAPASLPPPTPAAAPARAQAEPASTAEAPAGAASAPSDRAAAPNTGPENAGRTAPPAPPAPAGLQPANTGPGMPGIPPVQARPIPGKGPGQ
jgi:general secretion pathway protein D